MSTDMGGMDLPDLTQTQARPNTRAEIRSRKLIFQEDRLFSPSLKIGRAATTSLPNSGFPTVVFAKTKLTGFMSLKPPTTKNGFREPGHPLSAGA